MSAVNSWSRYTVRPSFSVNWNQSLQSHHGQVLGRGEGRIRIVPGMRADGDDVHAEVHLHAPTTRSVFTAPRHHRTEASSDMECYFVRGTGQIRSHTPAGNPVAGPVMEILVRHHALNAVVVDVGCGGRVGEDQPAQSQGGRCGEQLSWSVEMVHCTHTHRMRVTLLRSPAVEHVEGLVLHGAHVEVWHGDDVEQVQVVLAACRKGWVNGMRTCKG